MAMQSLVQPATTSTTNTTTPGTTMLGGSAEAEVPNIVMEWLSFLQLGQYSHGFLDNGYDDLGRKSEWTNFSYCVFYIRDIHFLAHSFVGLISLEFRSD